MIQDQIVSGINDGIKHTHPVEIADLLFEKVKLAVFASEALCRD